MGVRVLGVTLTTAQEILYWFLFPALLRAALFIAEIALVVGVAQHHFAQDDLRWGFATLAVLYTPSVAFFVGAVSQPALWEQHSTAATARWFCARVAQLLLFPAWAVYRYGKRLFWSVEALAARGRIRELALDKASQPSRIELYLFAHAFLHSAPQAALQLGVALTQCRLSLHVDATQVLCVLTSLGVLSMTLASFQRFESQRLAGRREPWRKDAATSHNLGKDAATSHNLGKDAATLQGIGKDAATPQCIGRDEATQHGELATPQVIGKDAATPQGIGRDEATQHGELATPQAIGKDAATPQGIGRDEATQHGELATPQAIGKDEATPLGQVKKATAQGISEDAATQESARHVETRPPRSPPPPPPGPCTRLLPPLEEAPCPPLPTRRRTVTALLDDDPLGRSVSAVGWFLFLLSRYGAVLSLASFRPGVVAGVLGAHTAVALAFLLRGLAPRTVGQVVKRCSLALVFLVCPMEYGVRFARPRLVFGLFLAVTCVEDLAMVLGWYLGDLEDSSFWHGYLVAVVCAARALSALCLTIYVALLRPKVTSFYVD